MVAATSRGMGYALVSLAGDYNHNGTVDAADYVVWRKNDGTQDGYNTWRGNFDRTAGSGAMSDATVPEPASAMCFLMLATIVYWRILPKRLKRSKTRLA